MWASKGFGCANCDFYIFATMRTLDEGCCLHKSRLFGAVRTYDGRSDSSHSDSDTD